MSHSYETNQKKFSRRENDSKSIWKHIHDLAKELGEILQKVHNDLSYT